MFIKELIINSNKLVKLIKCSQTSSPENNMIQLELFLILAGALKVKLSKAHINIRIIRIFIRI